MSSLKLGRRALDVAGTREQGLELTFQDSDARAWPLVSVITRPRKNAEDLGKFPWKEMLAQERMAVTVEMSPKDGAIHAQCLCRAALALLPEHRGMTGHGLLSVDGGVNAEREARHLR